jgi:ABC-2 type transport system permease protein
MLLLSSIQANIPIDLFQIENLTPGIAVFGLSFLSLFSGMLISKDRTNSFLMRMFASPMSASDFIYGYIIPLIPLATAQSTICFGVAILLGLTINLNILLAILILVPISLVFIGIGLLAGTLLNDKQVGGICGAFLTNVSAWLSGTWFELSLVGGSFEKIAYMLPFAHAVDATRAILSGDFGLILPHILWVLGYAFVIMSLAIIAFKKKMKT